MGHCRLTISAAFTNVPRIIQRGVNLRGSTYGLDKRLFPQAMGGPGENSLRFAVRHWKLTDSCPSADVKRFGTLPAHRLAGAHRRGALYTSRRAPHYSFASRTSLRPCWTAFLNILRAILILSVTFERSNVHECQKSFSTAC
jgi:hypothetical protein